MATPNVQLQQARRRLASPSAPGEPASRQDLADLVNAWIDEHRDYEACLTANYVGKLERGAVRWPSADYRAALREILGCDTDRELGFRPPRRPSGPAAGLTDVDRKGFLSTLAGVAAVPLLDPLFPVQPASIPAVVTPADIHELRTIAGVFSTWDHTYGGGMIREAVTAQVRYSVALLERARCPDRLRSELFGAVGWLSHTCAFMAFDAHAHDDARRLFRLALSCVEEAGDWHLRAKVLSSMARQAIWCGDADTGLTLVELALVRADRLTPAELAMVLSARARALAKLRRTQDTLATVGQADEEFSRIRPAQEGPWMRYYDAAQHAGDTGHALYDLAIHGQFVNEAANRLAAAVAGHIAVHVRSRALSGIKLASLTMAAGDPDEAAAIGRRAVLAVDAVRSRRAADDMRELHRLSAPHQRRPPVAELRQRLRTVVEA